MSMSTGTAAPDAKFALPTVWGLSAIVCLLAFVAWGQSFQWQFGLVSSYLFFPVLGLIGFSLMWSHYMLGLTRRLFFPDAKLDNFFHWSGYGVLLAIVLHPSILIYQRFRDGYGLPPSSYEHYVAPSLAWVTLLGSASLLIFLAFELRRWFGKRSWWRYVVYAGDIAMVAVFYHGLRLGSQTQHGWYHYVWLFYGISLIAVLLYNHIGRILHWRGARTV